MSPERIIDEFPAPTFRGNQREALEDIRDALAAENDVVLVRAPTGSGKSLLARAVMGGARRPDEADPTEPVGAYYTTPQVSQLDAVEADPLLSDLAVVRGKSNYTCLLPDERDTTVDRAPCARDRSFDCDVMHRCPYFSDREIAANRRYAAMTLAYFMRTAGSDAFGRRDVVVVDEAHGLAEWAEMYATIELNARTVPGWDDLSVPEGSELDGIEGAAVVAERVADACRRRLEPLRERTTLSADQAAERDRLADRVQELSWFVEDVADADSETEWLLEEGEGLTIKPLNPARYLHHTVWDRAETFVLLSATILDHRSFCRSVGLDPSRVAMVEVGHTFPLAHRRLYDVTRGKMTYAEREETIPKLAQLLVRLMARHPDEKGIVHAHSYGIQGELAKRLHEMRVGGRVRTHDRGDRDDQLAGWLATDEPEVFLSVKMEEALDLQGDLARWQVLCKAPFPNTNDAGVAHRLDDGQWDWYNRTALKTVIQACGRVVRSADDHGATYLADSSLLDLFDRARGNMPAWFREQVDAMSAPELPEFDPQAALAGYDGSVDASGTSGRSSRGGSVDAPTGAGEIPEDHPLYDVWGG